MLARAPNTLFLQPPKNQTHIRNNNNTSDQAEDRYQKFKQYPFEINPFTAKPINKKEPKISENPTLPMCEPQTYKMQNPQMK